MTFVHHSGLIKMIAALYQSDFEADDDTDSFVACHSRRFYRGTFV